MDTLQIQIPEGHEIDAEKSDLVNGVITFKKKIIRGWKDNPEREVKGYYISSLSMINQIEIRQRASTENLNTFATRRQAESALAMAQLSQIIANDPRFGGTVTDEEWRDASTAQVVIYREGNRIASGYLYSFYTFLAFHTEAQRDLFMKENMDLIKQYFML